MLVDKIVAYLEDDEHSVDEAVLAEAAEKFAAIVRRQLVRKDKPFHLSPHNVGKCPRQLSFMVHGHPRKALNARTRMTFLYGDLTELLVILLAKLAGCPLDTEDLEVQTEIGRGFLDGALPDVPVEVKSMSDQGFREFEAHGPDDKFGYLSQVQTYLRARDADRAIMVGLRKSTGHMHERVVLRDDEKFLPIVGGAKAAAAQDPAFVARPEWAQKSLKWMPRKKVYEITDCRCRYCDCIEACWPGVQMEVLAKGPVFRIPEAKMHEPPEEPPEPEKVDFFGCTVKPKRGKG